MNIQPLYDKVLVRRVDEETKTAGGIIIPDNAQEKPCEGIVEAVGEGFRTEDGKILPMAVKAGDRVLFAKWGGTEVKAGGETRLIIKESDILAVVK